MINNGNSNGGLTNKVNLTYILLIIVNIQ